MESIILTIFVYSILFGVLSTYIFCIFTDDVKCMKRINKSVGLYMLFIISFLISIGIASCLKII